MARSPSTSSPRSEPTQQPTMTHHPSHFSFLANVSTPTPGLIQSIAGAGAHYSDMNSVSHTEGHHRRTSSGSNGHGHSHSASGLQAGSGSGSVKHRRVSSVPAGEVNMELYKGVLEDLQDLYECRPTRTIMERRWRRDAVFEDPLAKCQGWNEIAPQVCAALGSYATLCMLE